MVRILQQVIVGGHIAEVIDGEHCSSPNLALEADIHLHGAWCHVIRSEKGCARSKIVCQESTDVSSVGLRALCHGLSLVRLLRGNDPGCSLANGLSIELVSGLEAQEKPLLQASARIKQDVVPNRVLVE